ncbi:hypothetical protein TNCV_2298451 [Trichonephila clavipes]|nr:hypothetical protein TNCV_2298451 [Trichonephila clavipes]
MAASSFLPTDLDREYNVEVGQPRSGALQYLRDFLEKIDPLIHLLITSFETIRATDLKFGTLEKSRVKFLVSSRSVQLRDGVFCSTDRSSETDFTAALRMITQNCTRRTSKDLNLFNRRASSFELVKPFLICVTPIASSLNTCRILRIVSLRK